MERSLCLTPLLRVLLPVALLLSLGACQTTRPALNGSEPEEPVTEVVVSPVPAQPVPAVQPPVAAPETPAEPERLDTGAEVFAKLEAMFTPPVCIKGERNRTWRRRYAGYPDSFARHLRDILPLLAYVVEEVDERELPGEFALIPIVESWYRPNAIGPGGPAGMWQMITSTARNHGVRVDRQYDGRLSPVDSTAAALSYLKTLDGMFGEWRATAMGYNAGEYRILRAFRADGNRRVSGESRLPKGLSNITYDYVAKLHALACLIAEPQRHNLQLPLDTSFTPLVEIDLPASANTLDQAARLLGANAEALRVLNPAFRSGRIVPSAPRRALAPLGTTLSIAGDTIATDAQASAAEAAAETESRTHRVVSGDTLWKLAQRYGVSIDALRRLNRLGTRAILRVGQELRIDP